MMGDSWAIRREFKHRCPARRTDLFLRLLAEGLGEPVNVGGGVEAEVVGTALRASAAVVATAAIAGAGIAVAEGGAAVVEIDLALHGQGDAVALEIDFHHCDVNFLTDFDDFGSVADEVVGELRNVDEFVLMDADIDEGTEGGDVGDDAGQLHADGEVGGFFDAVLEGEQLELFARAAAGFRKFGEDVFERRQYDLVIDVLVEVDFPAVGVVGEEFLDFATGVGGHFSDERVAFRVDGGRIERVLAVADTEEAGGKFERFVAEAGDLFQLGARGESMGLDGVPTIQSFVLTVG